MKAEHHEIELSELLQKLGAEALDWRWAASDLEFWLRPNSPARVCELVDQATTDIAWLSGSELADLASHIAVANWGVFLAFEAGARIEFVAPPQGEGYSGPIQHSQALLEIRAVDGGYLELVRQIEE